MCCAHVSVTHRAEALTGPRAGGKGRARPQGGGVQGAARGVSCGRQPHLDRLGGGAGQGTGGLPAARFALLSLARGLQEGAQVRSGHPSARSALDHQQLLACHTDKSLRVPHKPPERGIPPPARGRRQVGAGRRRWVVIGIKTAAAARGLAASPRAAAGACVRARRAVRPQHMQAVVGHGDSARMRQLHAPCWQPGAPRPPCPGAPCAAGCMQAQHHRCGTRSAGRTFP